MASPPALIAILRHGEKPPDDADHGLAPLGYQRAARLTTTLQPGLLLPSGAAAPDGFFVSPYAKAPYTQGHRPYETIAPLAALQGTAPEAVGKDVTDVDGLADAIAANAGNASTLVVCWEHHVLEDLLATLVSREGFGITPVPGKKVDWPGGDFGTVWLLASTGSGDDYAWTTAEQF